MVSGFSLFLFTFCLLLVAIVRYTNSRMSELWIITSTTMAIAALALAIVSWLKNRELNLRVSSLLAGESTSDDIEKVIKRYFQKIKQTDAALEVLQRNYRELNKIASASLQKTAIVRFNPFKHTGGDQSFVLAVLDNHDSGLLLTSIHSREGTRVYIKPVTYGSSDYTLSKEEKDALEAARSESKTSKEDK